MQSIEEQLEDSVVERLIAKIPAVKGRVYASVSLTEDDEVLTQRPPAILVQCTGSTPAPPEEQPKGAGRKRRRIFSISVIYVAQDLRITKKNRATVGLNSMKADGRTYLQDYRAQGGNGALEEGEESERGTYKETLLLLWEQEWTIPGYITAQQ